MLLPAIPSRGLLLRVVSWVVVCFAAPLGWCHAPWVLFGVVRALRVGGTQRPLLPSTSSCAVVLAAGVPVWRALWPRVGTPRLVRSGHSRCAARFYRRCGAVTAGFLATHVVRGSSGFCLCGFAGPLEASGEPGSWCLPASPC